MCGLGWLDETDFVGDLAEDRSESGSPMRELTSKPPLGLDEDEELRR
jgi:hypothetical protein